MTERMDIEARWPELCQGLDAGQRSNVVQSFAAAWHEGWTPNRDDVENLTDHVRGTITTDEDIRRW